MFTEAQVPLNDCAGSPQRKTSVRYMPSSRKEVNNIKIEVANESRQIKVAP